MAGFNLETSDFSFVTVMNVRAWTQSTFNEYAAAGTFPEGAGVDGADDPAPSLTMDSLSISNITQEGPVKEARGGQEARPIIRYKKTLRLEMEDVVMKGSTLTTFMNGKIDPGNEILSITEEFATYLYLVGETYVIDRETGNRELVTVRFYNFLPDSIFDLTMESEGDIGMINIGGELFATEDGVFFDIIKKA